MAVIDNLGTSIEIFVGLRAERLRPSCRYGSEIAAVIALTMMTTKMPTWSGIATMVSISQHTLQPRLACDNQTTVEQTMSAATGIRQDRATTNQNGGAGICKRDSHITVTT